MTKEFKHQWPPVVDEIIVLNKTIESNCSSIEPEELYRALVSIEELMVFSDFLPTRQVESVMSSQRYTGRLNRGIAELSELWPDLQECLGN